MSSWPTRGGQCPLCGASREMLSAGELRRIVKHVPRVARWAIVWQCAACKAEWGSWVHEVMSAWVEYTYTLFWATPPDAPAWLGERKRSA